MFHGKKVLVTGSAGFIGANLIKKLVNTGTSVRATLHEKPPQIVDERIEYVKCDLKNPADCLKISQNIDLIFLCAANTSGAAVIDKSPLVHLTPNIIMNTLMLEAAYAAQVSKVLFISSNVVYPPSDKHVKEDDVNNLFFSKYFIAAWMKRFSEIMCEMYSTKISKPMSTIIIRPANIYGPYDDFDWESSHVLPALIRKVVERHDPVTVWGDGKDIKDFIYIDDFIQGLVTAMERVDGFDTINIASGNEYRLKDILDIILKVDGYMEANIHFDPSKPSMIPTRLISTEKARNKLGFEAETKIETGLEKTIDWYRNFFNKKRVK